MYIYVDASTDRVQTRPCTRARKRATHNETMRAHARDCSDECHRSISRRGWNFWPSKGVRGGDEGKRVCKEGSRERKRGGREIEARMYISTHLRNASVQLGGRRTNDHSFVHSYLNSASYAHVQRTSTIGAESDQSVTSFPGS